MSASRYAPADARPLRTRFLTAVWLLAACIALGDLLVAAAYPDAGGWSLMFHDAAAVAAIYAIVDRIVTAVRAR